MIPQQHPRFKKHVSYLIDKVIKTEGYNFYEMRTEVYDVDDPYGTDEISCAGCDQPVSLSKECKWLESDYITYMDTLTFTNCCGNTVASELCPMVCVRCKRIALLLTPHKNKRGFSYDPGVTYHLDCCSECDNAPGMTSLILEQVVHDNLNGVSPD